MLVVAVPTGTGWMDPAGMDTLEYLHAGDVATVAVQYSYLTSLISILVEPGYGEETGRALFRAVYDHWTALPRDARPRLYLYGLSLGAISSEQSVRLHEVLADPIQGALWVGPPFPSPGWRSATDEREPGSPAWLPRFGDGSFVRFTNQENALDIPGAHWGPMRVVYLQYASDPIVFFEPAAFWRAPAWMAEPRGPDVSPELRWYPIVTVLQLLLDMAVGLMVPIGHGHLYAHAHYIDAWQAVTDPEGWTPDGDRAAEGAASPADAVAGRPQRLRRVLIGVGAVALLGLALVGGNTIGRYLGWIVPGREPRSLAETLRPFYRVLKPDGPGPVPDRAALFRLRRPARQPRALGGDAERPRLGGGHRRQPRAARLPRRRASGG